jgi:hypothetical protein
MSANSRLPSIVLRLPLAKCQFKRTRSGQIPTIEYELAPELVLEVLRHVDHRTLAMLLRVSRAFNVLAKTALLSVTIPADVNVEYISNMIRAFPEILDSQDKIIYANPTALYRAVVEDRESHPGDDRDQYQLTKDNVTFIPVTIIHYPIKDQYKWESYARLCAQRYAGEHRNECSVVCCAHVYQLIPIVALFHHHYDVVLPVKDYGLCYVCMEESDDDSQVVGRIVCQHCDEPVCCDHYGPWYSRFGIYRDMCETCYDECVHG